MLGSVAVVVSCLALLADPPSYRPTDEELAKIRTKTSELGTAIDELRSRHADADLLLDVEIYHKAATWIVRYADEEFYDKQYVADTYTALDHGLARAKDLAASKAAWPKQKGLLVRAYRSRIDDSIQPYALAIPAGYDGRKPVRLDVVLHGRAMKQNEVKFIAARDTGKPAAAELAHLQLDVFGRGNNAFRWAGETDVFEAIASVRKRYKIDPRQIVLRGFSMGGAGAWGLGMHYPDRWAAVEAGAGFSDTKRFLKITDPLPFPQELTLHIYDAYEYALNAFNVPTVAYGGEIDAQLQAAENVRQQWLKERFRFTPAGLDWHTQDLPALFLVGPKAGHKFLPASKQESEQFIQSHLPRKSEPNHIRFVTYTTRYNECFWLKIAGLEKHYERADVDARRSAGGQQVELRTQNVAQLILPSTTFGGTVTIDGQRPAVPASASGSAAELLLEKQDGRWSARQRGRNETGTPRKTHGLQGPIDDAFLEPFLCVRPTGTPCHKPAGAYGKAALDRFVRDFARWLHGEVRVKNDTDVTPADMAAYHLIVFGDPQSNRVLGQIAERLPIRWTRESIQVGKKSYPSADHVPVLICPNPLEPRRYVVVNSGHTFHEPEFRGNNALVYPRLGDFAVLKLDATGAALDATVQQAGLFNEQWQAP